MDWQYFNPKSGSIKFKILFTMINLQTLFQSQKWFD